MDTFSSPLRFPEHYPPTTAWKRFFIGVRWVGPDLSFLSELKARQATRAPDLMSMWGGGLRQEIAQVIGRRAHRSFRWKSDVFVPGDSFNAVIHGPTFGWGDDYPVESISEDLREAFGVNIPNEYWGTHENSTLGDVVDGLVALIGRGI